MLFVVVILMIIGLIGIFIPGLPGNGLIFGSSLGYAILTRFEKISIGFIVFLGFLTILSFILDYVGSMMGAKKFGATKEGIIGGIIGGLMGIFVFNIPGFLIGQFMGTLLGELYYGKELKSSVKSGFGTMIGYIFSVIINTTIGLTMIILFLVKVLR